MPLISSPVPATSSKVLLCLAFLALACQDAPLDRPGSGATGLDAPAPLVSPAGAGSAEPHLSSVGDGAVLSWLEPDDGGHALRLALWTPEGWGPVRTVVSRDDLFVNWADFPSVVPVGDELVAHWLQREGRAVLDYGVRVARSSDGGATWSEPWTPHEDGTPTEHGFVSIAPTADGAVGLLWLDGRAYAPGPDGAPATEEMSLRFRTRAADGTPGTTELVDPRTCDCCQTGMAATGEGLLAVYRDRSADEVRDVMAVRRVDGRWSEPVPVHADGWEIAACPVNGPQVDARGDRAAVAWFTAADDRPRVYVAFSDDAGRSFAEPVRVDGGNPGGRVDLLLLDDGSALVSWIERAATGPDAEGGSGPAEIRLRRVDPGGEVGAPLTVASSSAARASGFPRMARAGDGVLLTWTDVSGAEAESRVRTAWLGLDPATPTTEGDR